ncbi:hypothetical protein BGZ99_008915 [Dissophora globulifera]|uniref:Rho-GAP domain-containing protein n=1 Tax=Dissophora globulifera TaxID=979702 RepID=A0A9P6UP66_9FUNG|nr:hypothetical protein BGZ99_008915 [Dissophora globulifera]
MPSFLKRLSSMTFKSSGSSQSTKNDVNVATPHPNTSQRPSRRTNIDRNDFAQEVVKRNSMMSNASDLYSSGGHSSQASNSADTTLSSASSLSLSLPAQPSWQQPSDTWEIKSLQDTDSNQQQPVHTITNVTQQKHSDVQAQEHARGYSSSSSSSRWTSVSATSSSASSSTGASDESPTHADMPSVSAQGNEDCIAQKRGDSRSSLSALSHPRCRSMPMLQDFPDSLQNQSMLLSPVAPLDLPPATKRVSMDNLAVASRRPMSDNITSSLHRLSVPSPTLRGKKSRPKSLSSLLLQHEQQVSVAQPRLPHQTKTLRWANRGGIGTNEMMVDLETTGVFVPSSGKRLRAEFVYRTVIQCADEIRYRGLYHRNIFHNPSPKKVISSMIALLTDQDRCDLYSIQCLRIDTVAGLMLNLLSQMSNPVVPYHVMEHYFQQGGSNRSSTLSNRSSIISNSVATRRQSSTVNAGNTGTPMIVVEGTAIHSSEYPFPTNAALPIIPELPPRGPSYVTMAWAREHFDLPAFLDALPAMNRVILLEVLHLCQEILEHQIENRVTLTGLVQQFAPAIFSTVFDQKILETVAGGSRRCSIHGDLITPEEGSRAESHLFMVILVRFLYLTTSSSMPTGFRAANSAYNTFIGINSYNNNYTDDVMEEDTATPASLSVPSSNNGEDPTPVGGKLTYRKSQERLQMVQQEYYNQMELSYQQMEIQKQPSQHFGVYSAAQKQQQKQQMQLQQPQPQYPQSQDTIVPSLAMATMAIRAQHDHLSHVRGVESITA